MCDGKLYGVHVLNEELSVLSYMQRLADEKWHCTISGCTFEHVYKTNVKNHVRSHIGVKPFKCLFCSHTTFRKDFLLSHYHAKHYPMEFGMANIGRN